jgi:hypothetical protein
MARVRANDLQQWVVRGSIPHHKGKATARSDPRRFGFKHRKSEKKRIFTKTGPISGPEEKIFCLTWATKSAVGRCKRLHRKYAVRLSIDAIARIKKSR